MHLMTITQIVGLATFQFNFINKKKQIIRKQSTNAINLFE